MTKPLFVPLKTEHFQAFACGDKDTEFRLHGARWNERTCFPGRPVVLSKGYGNHARLNGVVESFHQVAFAQLDMSDQVKLLDLYGSVLHGATIAVIQIRVEQSAPHKKGQPTPCGTAPSSSASITKEAIDYRVPSAVSVGHR